MGVPARAIRPADPSASTGSRACPDLLRQAIARAGGVGRACRCPGTPSTATTTRCCSARSSSARSCAHWPSAAGSRSRSTPPRRTALTGYAATGSVLQRGARRARPAARPPLGLPSTCSPTRPGSCSSSATFMAEHFRTAATPGPIGHGFTQHNLDTGETWWQADLIAARARRSASTPATRSPGPTVRCPTTSSAGCTTQLEQAQAEQKPRADLQPPQQPHAREPGHPARARPAAARRRRVHRPAAALPGGRRLAQRPHPPQPDPRPRRTGERRVLGDHDGVVHRLPAAAAGRRARRQPRRDAVAVHDGARPRLAGHAGQQRQLPRPGVAEPRAGRPTTGPRRR